MSPYTFIWQKKHFIANVVDYEYSPHWKTLLVRHEKPLLDGQICSLFRGSSETNKKKYAQKINILFEQNYESWAI